jgi:hypothetical protein
MCTPTIEKHGASPAYIQWTVVRGDDATLRIEFFEDDESTYFDTDGWGYTATSYDSNGQVLDDLPVVSGDGYAEIQIPSTITEYWGSKYTTVVAELPFDLQVVIPGATVSGDTEPSTTWTPVIGTICVLGDVTPGGSL